MKIILTCKFKTYAKINLFLHVTGRRDDGYHLLESIFYFPDIFDEISFEEAPETFLAISGRFAKGLDVKDNLILKAYDLLKELFPEKIPELKFNLQKNLPVSAGIGGGSANAAGVLRELNRYYKLNLSDSELCKMGVKLGADVPSCIISKTSFVSGIGENIEVIENFAKLNILLVNPLNPVSTAEIFKMGFERYSLPVSKEGLTLDKIKGCKNDLQENAAKILPEILDILDMIQNQSGCLISRMSGSGATCYGIFDSSESLDKAYKNLSKNKPEYWVEKSH